MRADIKAGLIAQANTNLTAEQRVDLIEKAMLEFFGQSPQSPEDIKSMTDQINSIINQGFGPIIAGELSADIANALEQNTADSLIGAVAQIYGDNIAKLIANDPDALPQFLKSLGALGDEITSALGDNLTSALPGDVATIITNDLNSIVSAKIAALVSDADVDAALADAVTAAEMPSAQLTVAVYSYKGD